MSGCQYLPTYVNPSHNNDVILIGRCLRLNELATSASGCPLGRYLIRKEIKVAGFHVSFARVVS